MSPRRTVATARRVLQQLSHDHRTLGLLFIVPVLLMGLLAWIFSATPAVFDRLGPALLCVFPFTMMFIVTSVSTLRERSSGTLERLLTMPVGKLDLLLGYLLSFGLLAIVQSVLVSAVSLHVYGMDIRGPEWFLVLVALGNALLGTALGLLASAFARSEFQAVQFMPAFVLPQLLLCGLLVPVAQLPTLLGWIAQALPFTYAIEAVQLGVTRPDIPAEALHNMRIVGVYILAAVLLAVVTLRRRSR